MSLLERLPNEIKSELLRLHLDYDPDTIVSLLKIPTLGFDHFCALITDNDQTDSHKISSFLNGLTPSIQRLYMDVSKESTSSEIVDLPKGTIVFLEVSSKTIPHSAQNIIKQNIIAYFEHVILLVCDYQHQIPTGFATDLIQLTVQAPNLHHIIFHDIGRLTLNQVDIATEKLIIKNIEFLLLEECFNSGEYRTGLCRKFQNIDLIDITPKNSSHSDAIQYLSNFKFLNTETLRIIDYRPNTDVDFSLKGFTFHGLKELYVRFISLVSFEYINLPQLKILWLDYEFSVSTDRLFRLNSVSLPNLDSLNIQCSRIPVMMTNVDFGDSLSSIMIQNTSYADYSISEIPLDYSFVDRYKHCLRSLVIPEHTFNWNNFKSLETLRLYCSKKVSSEVERYVFPKLKELEIDMGTGSDIIPVVNAPELETLKIGFEASVIQNLNEVMCGSKYNKLDTVVLIYKRIYHNSTLTPLELDISFPEININIKSLTCAGISFVGHSAPVELPKGLKELTFDDCVFYELFRHPLVDDKGRVFTRVPFHSDTLESLSITRRALNPQNDELLVINGGFPGLKYSYLKSYPCVKLQDLSRLEQGSFGSTTMRSIQVKNLPKLKILEYETGDSWRNIEVFDDMGDDFDIGSIRRPKAYGGDSSHGEYALSGDFRVMVFIGETEGLSLVEVRPF